MNAMPYDYAEFQRRAREAAQRRHRLRRALAATACCAVLFVGGAAWLARAPADGNVGGDNTDLVSSGLAAATSPASAAPPALLTDPPAETAIVHVASGMAATHLEDRIAAVDEQLNDAQFGGDTLSRIHSLRNERMQLIDSLVRVRYAEQLAAAVR